MVCPWPQVSFQPGEQMDTDLPTVIPKSDSFQTDLVWEPPVAFVPALVSSRHQLTWVPNFTRSLALPLITLCLLLRGQASPHCLTYLCIFSTKIASLSLLPPPLLCHRPLFLSHAFLILLSPCNSLPPALCVLSHPTDSIPLLVPILSFPWPNGTHLSASPVQFPRTASSDITLEDSLLPSSPSSILVAVLVPSEFKS